MASVNPFDLLGDDDSDDPTNLIAAAAKKAAAAAAAAAPVVPKLPAKPVPGQAVKEARYGSTETTRGGGGGGRGGTVRGRGGRGESGFRQNRDVGNGNMNGFNGGYAGGGGGGFGFGYNGESKPSERGRGDHGPPRQPFHGGRRGGDSNEEWEGADSERPPRRVYERRSGNGRGYDMKREGAGRGNWGTPTDDVIAQETAENLNVEEKAENTEKLLEKEDGQPLEENKEIKNETEEKEPEVQEMTLDEYEKIREEKRKALLAMKTEERKVNVDKEFETMQQLSIKKDADEIFIKLGSEKEASKRRDTERAKKSVSITEFLKPADGERHYSPGGRGRGRGRGADRGSFRGGFGNGGTRTPVAPSIEDPGQFPTLGGK